MVDRYFEEWIGYKTHTDSLSLTHTFPQHLHTHSLPHTQIPSLTHTERTHSLFQCHWVEHSDPCLWTVYCLPDLNPSSFVPSLSPTAAEAAHTHIQADTQQTEQQEPTHPAHCHAYQLNKGEWAEANFTGESIHGRWVCIHGNWGGVS